MRVIYNAAQVVCVAADGARLRRGPAMHDIAVREHASVILEHDRISWVGPTAELPSLPVHAEMIDTAGKVVLPGLVDSHTHLIFAGARADEFEQRLQGKTYQEIAAGGGGINASVRRVRESSKAQLVGLARP